MTTTDITGPGAVRSWLGIPYAPADRFRSPKVVPFDPDLPYDQKGPAPLQAGDTSWLEADNGFSEDCLNLNIWAPVDAGDEPLPVVVYIFGGGWMLGAPSADGLYHHLAAFSGMPSRQVPAWGAEERALAVLTALGIQDDPEQLLHIDANLLAETMSRT